jgi:hypothetical protein
MTASEAVKHVGKLGHIVTEGRKESQLSVNVRVTDVRVAYGKIQYQITPLSGNGLVWIDDFRFTEAQ